MKNVVIIGAGPVGLWSAIQVKKRNPDVKITLYEKYTTYKRNHVLKIQHSSLFFGASRWSNVEDEMFFNNVFGVTRRRVKRTPLKKSFITTKSIESNLRQWVLDLGCEIVYEEVQTLSDLALRHDEATPVIIADGAHSKLRKEILGDRDAIRTDLQHIVELKSQLKCTPDTLKANNVNSAIKSQLNSLGFEYVGKANDNLTPINLRLFISEELYNEVPDATFKSPITDPALLPIALQDDLSRYAKLHGLSVDELFVEGKVSKLQLSVYHATQFAKTVGKRHCYLVGDAAMGVPYFRSLNCGFVLASRLAMIMEHCESLTESVARYNQYSVIHRKAEESLAKGKNRVINTYNGLRKLYKINGM